VILVGHSYGGAVICATTTGFYKTDSTTELHIDEALALYRFGTLVVQDDMQQRAVDLQPAVVVNKSQFPEPVHEEANP
jgi:hypothetical protein